MAVFRYLVLDVDESIAYYRLLGFVESERWGPPFAIMKSGDIELWLSGPGTSAARALPDGTSPSPGGWNRVVLPIKDLEAKVAELQKLGCQFRSPIIEGPGGKQVLALDPSGNPVELFEPKS